MGCFSWCTSDTRESIPCVLDAYTGAPKTVYLLNPFGEPYKESDYEGYGEFGGHDVYDLVVDWNRKYLTAENLHQPDRGNWALGAEGDAAFERVMNRYLLKLQGIKELAAGASDEYMREKYGNVFGYGDGSDWKRCLGIDIACYDEDHVKLRYPIKIVETPCDYNEAKISPSCPFQGCFYPDSHREIQYEINKAFESMADAQVNYLNKLKDKQFASVDHMIAAAEGQRDNNVLDSAGNDLVPER